MTRAPPRAKRGNASWSTFDMWYIRHKRENLYQHRATFAAILACYYFQWRDPDGSIPWAIGHDDVKED